MIKEVGYCQGIENYSRHLTNRLENEPPPTLLDYFPSDSLFMIDESHATIPQLNGMYRGDRSRKEKLIRYGFRLPSAFDNRPLKSYIMSIHKQASELYNILDDTEDPEEWVMEKVKGASSAMNAIHGHISYAKDKVEALEGTLGEKPQERGY